MVSLDVGFLASIGVVGFGRRVGRVFTCWVCLLRGLGKSLINAGCRLLYAYPFDIYSLYLSHASAYTPSDQETLRQH